MEMVLRLRAYLDLPVNPPSKCRVPSRVRVRLCGMEREIDWDKWNGSLVVDLA